MEIFMPPKEVMTIQQIRDAYSSNDYNAELLLKHLLIRVAELEAKLAKSSLAFEDQTRELENAVGLLGELGPENALEFRRRTYPDLYPRP